MNLSTLRSDVIDYMDAQDSERWDSSPRGVVDRRISSVFDSLWRDILNAAPYYRVGTRTPTSDVNGRYLFSDLEVNAGDLTQRLYRVIGVAIDGFTYKGPESFKLMSPQALYGNGDQRVWYEEGTNLVALPIQASKIADAVWVNWMPQRPDQLEDDNSSVDFPADHEEVLIGYSAARLLTKAGAETAAANDIKNELLPEYRALLADVARRSTAPWEIAYSDSAIEWGGN